MKLALIVNPNAGRKKGRIIAQQVAARLSEKDFETSIYISETPGDSLKIAKSLPIEEFDGIIALGGDGTLFEIVNGLLSTRKELAVPLGQIPVGTGNSFLRDFDVFSVDQALEKICSGKTRAVDLGHFSYDEGSFYFANLLGAGFVSDVAYNAKRFKALGPFSYILAVLESTIRLNPNPTRITIDGQLIEREALFVEVCNSRYTGGGMMMAPTASIDDGLLDIVLLSRITRRKLLSIFPKVFKGTHVDDPCIEVFQGKEITVESERPFVLTPDGETFGSTPIKVRIHPQKIRMFG